MVELSVIIPTLNEAHNLPRCVASAREAGARDIVVSDGGSSDETCALAERLGCRVVRGTPGRAAQQNRGAREAGGQVLLFLHADNGLGENVLRQLDAAVGRGARCGAFRQRIEAAGLMFRALEQGNALRAAWLGVPFGDQAIFVTRPLFDDAGGFPDVPLMEDVLLMKRLRWRAWPRLLPGPVFVNARRWQTHGVVRQTLRNWSLQAALAVGVPPGRLAACYRRHDQKPETENQP